MEIAIRTNTAAPAPKVVRSVPDSQTPDDYLHSIAECVEEALARVTFTAREIEGVLALDDPSWRSLGRMSDE